jgi:hypothetical protein
MPRNRNPVAANWCGTTHPAEFPPTTTGTQYVKRNAERRKDAAEKMAATIPTQGEFSGRSAILPERKVRPHLSPEMPRIRTEGLMHGSAPLLPLSGGLLLSDEMPPLRVPERGVSSTGSTLPQDT